jgi:hypothetical protein
MDTPPLSVFVSYAHESDEHSAWVKHLADALEKRPDFHVIFDQYELHGGKDLTHFMERGVGSDRIVVVVTPEYIRRAEARVGGVGYEASIISAELLANQLADRFVPALRSGDNRPSFLKSKVFVDFRRSTDFEASFDKLVAALHRIPTAARPAKVSVGEAPARHSESAADEVRRERGLVSSHSRPLVVIKCDADGSKSPTTVPAVENIGRVAATNIRIEDICVNGARGTGTFGEIDILRPGESRDVNFDAPDEGMAFRDQFVGYLENDLRSRPPVDWEVVAAKGELFTPLKMPMAVVYRDPATGHYYRSIHELEFTFGKHVKVSFRGQEQVEGS